MIVIDTLRADRISSYGWSRPTTPRLDKLAAEGVRFADVTSQSSWTKPSMVSLWTGQYVTAYQDNMHPEQPNLPEALRYEGYATIGVAGNVLLSEVEGFDRGFDHYDAYRLNKRERRARKRAVGESGPCRDAVHLIDDFLRPIDAFLEESKGGEESSGASRQPLFGYLHPMEPHAPYLEHPSLAEEFPQGFEGARFPSAWHEATWVSVAGEALASERGPMPQNASAQMSSERVLYERELRYLDGLIGGLLDGLEDRGLLDNALVIVASDHGEGLFDHLGLATAEEQANMVPGKLFQMQHGANLQQPLIATPLIVWRSQSEGGHVVETPVENVDLFPTVLELCGAEPNEALHGRSLVPLLNGEEVDHKPYVHSFVATKIMAREVASGHKLIIPTKYGTIRGAVPAMYDLKADPLERRNLIRSHPAEASALSDEIAAWQAAHPTVPTNPNLKDPTTLEDLRALGYLGDE